LIVAIKNQKFELFQGRLVKIGRVLFLLAGNRKFWKGKRERYSCACDVANCCEQKCESWMTSKLFHSQLLNPVLISDIKRIECPIKTLIFYTSDHTTCYAIYFSGKMFTKITNVFGEFE
jgi:hypothetical protein